MSYRKHSHYKDKKIDREKICPFLVRVFYRNDNFNSLKDFDNNKFPSDELHIYTWYDATLRELTTLISSALDLTKVYKLKYAFLYYDSKGILQRKNVGDVYLEKRNSNEDSTLSSLRFVIGDYIDICIEK